jgi:hydrogenase-4 membrane subunit HyfE
MLVTVHIILDQAVSYCSHYFGSGCWLLFTLFWIRMLLLFKLFCINLLVTVPIILNQAVGYCFHYFESGSWSLFLLFWIRLLVNVPIILDQAVRSCSGDLG